MNEIVEVRIGSSTDDAEEKTTGKVYLSSTDLDLVDDSSASNPRLDQTIGLRFGGLAIPQGAIITNAYIQFQADETSSVATSLLIHGQDTGSAATFANINGDISSRGTTNASALWDVPEWDTVGEQGLDQRSTDISAVVQEIISRPDWQSGNALALIITGSGERVAESFDGISGAAPLLHIEYSFDNGNTPPVVDSGSVTVVEDTQDSALGLIAPTDPDGDPLTITVVSLPDPSKGSVTLANGTPVVVGQVLTEPELAGLQYDTVADASGPAGQLVYAVSDGTVVVNGTLDLDIAPVNDAPTIANLSGDSQSYIAGNGQVVIEQGNDAVVQDADSQQFDGGRLTVAITNGGDTSEDVVSVQDQGSGSGQIGFDGNNITYGGVLIGTASGGSNGAPFVATLNSVADADATTALVRAVTYENSDTVDPTTGVRGVDFSLSDGDGGTSANFSATVAVSTAVTQSLEVRVSQSTDDAEEKTSGRVYLASSDLDLVDDRTARLDQTIGLRFSELAIPQGAIVTNAYIQFQADEADSIATSLLIHGQDTGNAATFAGVSGDISSRTTTASSTLWNVAEWATVGEQGPDQRSADISAVVQEIISRPDWQSGNALALIITGTGQRVAEAYDGVSSAAPLLHLEFATPGWGTPSVDLDADGSSGATGGDHITHYLAGSAAVAIADVDVVISDSNDTQMVSAQITLTNAEFGDQLSIGTLPTDISLDPSSTATELILTGPASLADYSAAISAITFANTEVGATIGDRIIEVTVNDGATDSAVSTATISVTPAPLLNFWVIGDSPYNAVHEAALAQYLGAVPEEVDFIIHVGDIKSEAAPITLDVYQNVADLLLASPVPVFIIPGDNEYNDTPDPDTAWANWETTFSSFDQNWSHNFPVAYQEGREENFSFVSNGVLFTGINLVGGVVHDLQEWADRSADDLAWIEQNLAQFGDQVTSAVIFGHANPGKNAYQLFEQGLIAAAQDFAKPILYVQGDNHQWLLDTPYVGAPDFSRVIIEQTGDTPDAAPLLVSVFDDPSEPFGFDRIFVSDSDVSADQVSEGATNGTAVGITALAVNVEAPDTVTYSLSNDAGGRFAIDPNSGVITVLDTTLLDYEVQTSHIIEVTVTSGDGSSSVQGFNISLTDDTTEFTVGPVSDADVAVDQVSESAVDGTAVGITALATDGDGTDTVTYVLTDDAGGRFTVDAASGVITVADSTLLDYQTQPDHVIEVTATSSDGSSSLGSFVVNLAPSGAVPTDIEFTAAAGIDRSAGTGTVVGTAMATGQGTAPTYALTNDAAGRFTIDATNGEIKLNVDYDFASATSHTITVETADSDSITYSEDVSIHFGTTGTDTITGTSNQNIMYGLRGDDILTGGSANDQLDGGAGIDILDGGGGNDTLRAGDAGGSDTFVEAVSALNPEAHWRLGENTGTTAVDETGNHDGTYNNGVALGVAGAHSGIADTAADFDRSDDYLTVSHSTDFELVEGTIQFWFNADDVGAGKKHLMHKDDGDKLAIFVEKNKLKVSFGRDKVEGTELNADQWYHVAFTWGPNGLELYLDGTLVDVKNSSKNLVGNSADLIIGAKSDPKEYFDGTIDEIAIFDTQLSQSQIVNLIDKGENGSQLSGNETLLGGTGDDLIIAGVGADIVDGGSGIDTTSYEESNAGVNVDLNAATAIGSYAEGDTLISIENLIGSAFRDTLSGDAGNNLIDGGAGADSMIGLAGDDAIIWDFLDSFIDGGTGSDTLLVTSGDVDLTTFAGTISGIEQIDLSSDAGANTLTLTSQDVLEASDTDVLRVVGDTGDTVNAGTGWTDEGVSDGFHIYSQDAATLYVDTNLTMNLDLLI